MLVVTNIQLECKKCKNIRLPRFDLMLLHDPGDLTLLTGICSCVYRMLQVHYVCLCINSVAWWGLKMRKYFSHEHKLHLLEEGLKGEACFKIFHVIWKFRFQMCLLSSVLVLLLGLLKEALWFAYLVLKAFSVNLT